MDPLPFSIMPPLLPVPPQNPSDHVGGQRKPPWTCLKYWGPQTPWSLSQSFLGVPQSDLETSSTINHIFNRAERQRLHGLGVNNPPYAMLWPLGNRPRYLGVERRRIESPYYYWCVAIWLYGTHPKAIGSKAKRIISHKRRPNLTPNACWLLKIRCVVRRIFARCEVQIWFGIRSGGCFGVKKLV